MSLYLKLAVRMVVMKLVNIWKYENLIFTLIPDASLDQEVGAARRRLLGRGRFRHGEDQTFYFYLEDFTLAKNRRRWFKSMSEPPPKNGLD